MLNRRTLLVALGTAAFALSNSFAQKHPGKTPRIGWLVPTTQAEWDGLLEQYRLGMRELGYIEGQSVETEYVYADGHFASANPTERLSLSLNRIVVFLRPWKIFCEAARNAGRNF